MKMKKKIKDLTLDDYTKTCDKHEDCKTCPLKIEIIERGIVCAIDMRYLEVEIDE